MRAWLKGLGPPIPLEALPDSLASGLPQYYIFQDGETFVKADAIEEGYTHFEVWCFGAAGGEGGGLSNSIGFDETNVYRTMTNEEWNYHLEYLRVMDYFTAGQVWDHQYAGWSHPSQPNKFLWTVVEMEIANNPTRQLKITTFTGAHWIKDHPSIYWARDDYIDFWGGAGGGGGLHVISGPLVDIPDEVLVRVGNAGVNSEPGHSMLNGVWTPIPEEITRRRVEDPNWIYYNPDYVAVSRRERELSNYFSDLQYFYPEPRTSFNLAQPGGDGGSSSFGDICLASGGKGGGPAITWPGGVKTATSYGGAGGIGDELVAGGGASGSTSFSSMGQDGTWNGVIGKGGGGGTGGGEFSGTKFATDGGRGSYSFADTSVYGHRQLKSADGLNGRKTGLMYRGGGGGGARTSFILPGKVTRFGSHAVGYSPKGGVIIRVYKVD